MSIDQRLQPQADEAVVETVAAFEQSTGKQVDLVQLTQDELLDKGASGADVHHGVDQIEDKLVGFAEPFVIDLRGSAPHKEQDVLAMPDWDSSVAPYDRADHLERPFRAILGLSPATFSEQLNHGHFGTDVESSII